MRLHRGQEKRTLLDFPVTKLPAFVEEVKPPVESFLSLNRSRPSAVPTAFKEIKLFMVTNRVVVSKKPFLLDRKDVIQREAFGEGPVKIKRAFGLSLESPVVAGKVASEKGVGRLFGPDPCEAHFLHEPVLEDAEESFNPPFGLGRIGMNHSDPELLKRPLELALSFSLALELFLKAGLGPGSIGGVFIQVNRLREAVTVDITLEAVQGGEGAFVIVEAGKDSIGGIINAAHEHKPRPPSLEPVVVGSIHLDHFSQAFLTLPPAAVFPGFFPRLPEMGFEEPLSQGFSIHPDFVSLDEFLLGEGGTKTPVTSLAEPEGFLLETIGALSVGRLAAEPVDDSSRPFFPEPLHETLDLPQGKLQVFRCLRLFESFLRNLLNDMQSFELSGAHRYDPLFFHPVLLFESGC